MDAAVLKDTETAIVDNLQLREGNYLRNAAVLLFHENPETTIPELAEITGVSTRSVERNIKKLQDAGKLRRVGPAKGGHWKVLG